MPLPQDFGPPLDERELISEEQRKDWDERMKEAEQLFGTCIVLARDFMDDAPARQGELAEARRAILTEFLACSVRQLEDMADVENEKKDEYRIAKEESGLPYWDREARRRRRQQERREAHRRRLDGISRAREEHQQQGDGLGGENNAEGEEGSQEGEGGPQEGEDDSQETESDPEGSDDDVEESEDDAEEPNDHSEEADESPEGADDDSESTDDERLPDGLSPISEEQPSSARPARSILSRIPWLQNRLRRRARVEADAGQERGRSMSEEPRSIARRPSVSSVRSFPSSPSPSA